MTTKMSFVEKLFAVLGGDDLDLSAGRSMGGGHHRCVNFCHCDTVAKRGYCTIDEEIPCPDVILNRAMIKISEQDQRNK